jgi:hypothetical protein
MPEVVLIVEDSAQELFLRPLIERLAAENKVLIHIRIKSARGGLTRVLEQLQDLQQDCSLGVVTRPDCVVVAVDSNCRGFIERRDAIDQRAGSIKDLIIHAIADPHIERWYLLDGRAFKAAVGKGYRAPDAKCEKDRYNRLLAEAVTDAGVSPLLGGVEYAKDIVGALNIERAAASDPAFGKLVAEFRQWLNGQKKAS